MQVHSVLLASKLAESGYFVDLFLRNCSSKVIELNELAANDKITVYEIAPDLQQKIQHKISNFVGRHITRTTDSGILPQYIVPETLERLQNKSYKCFIGIEKKGLVWAGQMAQKCRVPYIYYSLELYLEDHPAFADDAGFAALRREEIKFHKASKATIIQDRMRAKALLQSNGMASTDLLFLPVSLAEEENESRHSWFADNFNIPTGKNIVLYYGLIDKDRRCFDLAECSNRLEDDCIMVFHGFGPDTDIEPLRDQAKHANLVLSLNLVERHEIKNLISSAAIGLVMYGKTCNNDMLTAFSSEKIALYLQSGIPIVAFDMGNYRELIDAHRCGELISEMTDLPGAVSKIMDDYDRYRANAFSAYRELYRYEKHFNSIKEYLSSL